MAFPNVLTIYFQEKHQKFLFGFEWFGIDIALIGTGNKGKKKPEYLTAVRLINSVLLKTRRATFSFG